MSDKQQVDVKQDESDVLVQKPPCGRGITIKSQPGRDVEIRADGRTVLLVRLKCEFGDHEPWLVCALERALAHAGGTGSPNV